VKKTTKRTRGKFLTSVLIINVILLVYDIVSFIIKGSWHNNPLRMVTFPFWYDYVYLSALALSAVCLIFIFLWKKWAVYISFLKGILYFLVELFLRNWNTSYKGQVHHVLYHNLIEFNVSLAIFAIFIYIFAFWPIFRKWKYFE
jgi:hypothetical protein